MESARSIPVIEETDIVIVGGSSGAVAAAVAARLAGSNVFVVAPLPYLGDDICGSFLYRLDKKNNPPRTALARKLFLTENDPRESYPELTESEIVYEQPTVPTPLHVKTVLENELIDNGIPFLYSSYVTDILSGPAGEIAGVVIANRSGRQAIRSKAVIDATLPASAARLGGAAFTPFVPGRQTFEYTVVGNAVKEAPAILQAEKMPFTFSCQQKAYPIIRYTFDYELKDNTYASLAEAEQFIRDLTWDADQVDSSDLLWYTPSQHILPQQDAAAGLSLSHPSLTEPYVHNVIKYKEDGIDALLSPHSLPQEAFLCKGKNNLWVSGPCAALPREVAAWLALPVNAMTLGEMIGEWASAAIESVSLPTPGRLARPTANNTSSIGKVKEILVPLRPHLHKGNIESAAASLPVLGHYDVVVMGGGTAGAPAGVSAARQGAKTLVLEYLHGLGGLTTLGFIGCYWDGFREGFTAEIDRGVRQMAPEDHPRQLKSDIRFRADWKIEWYRRELRKHNADIWYGAMGCGALVNGSKVTGIVVATPQGRGIVLAETIIDSTGSADIAIAAGASYEYTGKKTIAAQGGGLSRFNPDDYYNNTDWTLIDDSDILDVSRLFIQGKAKYGGNYDVGKLPQTRERRRMVGEYCISVYDILNHRRYADTISYHRSSFDTHGMTIDPFFTLNPPGKRHVIYDADVPLRALLPKGLEGIVVTGLGASAHRDAMPVIRMQPCLQNQGYSVGYLAALAAKGHLPLRKVNLRKMQRHLVEKGVLPARVLHDKEFKAFTDKELETAATRVADNYQGLEILLSTPARSLPLLRKKMAAAPSGDAQLRYASILCISGDKEYAPIIAARIRSFAGWDKGWHYTASAQFGECMSQLDSLIIALGNTRDASVLPVILKKAEMLRPDDYFSHFRAVCEACEAIDSHEAVPVLHRLLTLTGMRHHDLPSYIAARNRVVPYIHDITYRNRIWKELHLARALYLCGDQADTARQVLQRYARGLEGHYARFAKEILNKE